MQNNPLNIKKVKYGKVERYRFGKARNVPEMPYLLQIQKDSYKKFLSEGIKECLDEFTPIEDYAGRAHLYFVDYFIEEKPKLSKMECKRRGANYSVPLKAKARLVLKETGEVKEQDVYLCDIPFMTNEASFIFNGVERVIVNHIVRSPGVYFDGAYDKTGRELFTGSVIPMRGPWFEFEQNNADSLKIVVDRTSKVTVATFFKCYGFENEEIKKIFGNNELVNNIVDKEALKTQNEALIELAKKMRPNDVPVAEATKKYINDIYFTPQYYSLQNVGRYKYNKKLSLATRITGQTLAENVEIDKSNTILAGTVLTEEQAKEIQNCGINEVFITLNDKKHKVIGNNQVKLDCWVNGAEKETGITNFVYYPALKEILKANKTKEAKIAAIKENIDALVVKTMTMDDMIASVSYILDLNEGIGSKDNIDHLANRRVAPGGELLTAAFRSGVNKLCSVIRETMQSQDIDSMTPAGLVNARHINKSLKDFIATSQLSQLMDEVNPVASLTQKRKLSSVGPGGIKKERAGAEVRDVNYSQYGRICAIETPEGQSIGLINSLACYAKLDEYGFITAPYRKVDKATGKVSEQIVYLSADAEDNYILAQATEPLDENGKFVNARAVCRFKENYVDVPVSQIDYIDVAPNQFVSAVTSLIPFVENNEAARALMGSNMQRQAVPLLKTEAPIVGTGVEHGLAVDSGYMIVADVDGTVEYVDAQMIKIRDNDGIIHEYELTKFAKTNHDTCICQKPITKTGATVKIGDVIADGYSTQNGEMALGKNMLVAFMTWEGYNYEDAILISERISKEDLYTSITLIMNETKARTTKLGDEEITRDIPNLSEDALKNLDENGIIRVGAEVMPGDILVGKVTPKGETELTPEERLLRAIFGEKAREVRDTSLRVQHGAGGVVVDVQIFSRKNKDDLDPGVNTYVKVFLAQKRKLSVGDKMAGRHGNKGVISRILPESDMPYMANGQPVDILLSPLGIPSRMNIGQLLETHLGLVAKTLGWKVATPSFDGASYEQVQQLLKENNFPENGKITLYDGRTGQPFDNPITVGYQYMIKLDHMVDSKMHARSTGPYSLVTQQPLGGKAMFGGQRFGEMEVWALEAYGAANILQEILTVKSDDVIGRTKTFEAIVQGKPIAEPGIPESFKVLIKELQSLALDVTILTDGHKEISMNQISGDENDTINLLTEEEKKPLEEVELSIDDEVDLTSVSGEELIYSNSSDFDENNLFDDFE